MARRADDQRRAIRLARLDERIGRIEPWHSALVDLRGELVAQREALDVDADDRDTRRAAELADAIECIDLVALATAIIKYGGRTKVIEY